MTRRLHQPRACIKASHPDSLYACRSTGHALFVTAPIAERKLRIELPEAEQRRSWAGRAKLNESLLVLLAEVVDDLPEVLDRLVALVEPARIDGVVAQVIDVDARLCASD